MIQDQAGSGQALCVLHVKTDVKGGCVLEVIRWRLGARRWVMRDQSDETGVTWTVTRGVMPMSQNGLFWEIGSGADHVAVTSVTPRGGG